jgi:hypothetical protein
MPLSTLLIIYAAWCLFRGVGFIFSPTRLWKTFNVNLDKHAAFPVQLLGGAFIATAVVSWTVKNSISNSVIDSILLFIFLMELIQALVTIYGIFRNAVAKHALGPFIIHLLFSIGFGYFLFFK